MRGTAVGGQKWISQIGPISQISPIELSPSTPWATKPVELPVRAPAFLSLACPPKLSA